MSKIINSNVASLNTQRNLNTSQSSLNNSNISVVWFAY